MKFDYNRLKAERVAKGRTVQDMADVVGWSKGYYSKKENGKVAITVDDFAIIANELEVPHEKINIFFTPSVAKMETSATC